MAFQIVITKHFEKQYLKKHFVSKEMIVTAAKEIEAGIFYDGEGRVSGSKMLFKKRLKLPSQSKRRGGRILFLVFFQVNNIYVPYAVWMANDSRKHDFDQALKNKKAIQKIIQETIAFMKASNKDTDLHR